MMVSGRIVVFAMCLSGACALRRPQLGRPASRQTFRRAAAPVLSAMPPPEPSPDESEESYSVDWDSAWQKEISARDSGAVNWRPEGREPVPEDALREARLRQTVDGAQASLNTAAMDW